MVVKVKIIKNRNKEELKYVDNVYYAYKFDHDDGTYHYLVQVGPYDVLYFEPDCCEEVICGEPTTLGMAQESNIKKISMFDIMDSLGINEGDIVHVSANHVDYYLKCNEKYELVFLNNKNDLLIPKLILGMITEEYDYTTYSVEYVCKQVKRG